MAPRAAVLLVVALVATFEAVRRGVALMLGAVTLRARPVSLRRLAADMRRRAAAVLRHGPLGRVHARALERRRQAALRTAMPEMLRLLCIALDAGSSLVQALSYAAANCDEPLAGELERAVWDMESGQGFEEAMEKLRTRAACPEFNYLAVALEVQHKTGSSLSEVLAAVSDSLHNVAELEESLATQTAQGRLSARIVALMPFAVLALLCVLSPGYLVPFFESALGVALLVFALLLELLGCVLVRKALAVDVSAGALGRQ